MTPGALASGASDHELISAVGRGDSEALAVLFERHSEAVRRLCDRIVGDAGALDDLVQEAFLRVSRGAGGFEGRSAFTTWLHRLVRNVCMDHLTREARKRALHHRYERSRPTARVVPREWDPRLAALRRALYALAPEKREVLVLSRYEGYSYREIAAICGTTEGAIKVRAHRAMRELREILESGEEPREL